MNTAAGLNLQKLTQSELNYQSNINDTLSIIRNDKNVEAALKKVILFCKYMLNSNGQQKKKYLCLQLIKDISDNFKLQYFDKSLDEHIPSRLIKTITQEIIQKQITQSKTFEQDEEYSSRLVNFAIETLCFWSRKLSHLGMRSNFAQANEELKKLKVSIPKNFEHYRMQKILTGIFGQKDDHQQQFIKNEQMTPLLSQLHDKFEDCKSIISQRLNIALENQQQIYLKDILQKIRDFLLLFFSRYKALEEENSIDRDVLIVYFHIMNTLFKRISNRIYIQTFQMIHLTKEIFEGTYSSDFTSIDRMDIVNLAGIHKYNALTIFQRIHQRIQQQEKKLGVCQITIEQQNLKDRQREKERDRQLLRKNTQQSKEKLQAKSRITERSDENERKFNRVRKQMNNVGSQMLRR